MGMKYSFKELFGVDYDYVDDAESLAFEFIMEFGDKVLNQIDSQGMSQKELAEHAGMSASSLSKVLSGNSNPTVKTLERIAMAAGLEMTHVALNAFGANAIRYNNPKCADALGVSSNKGTLDYMDAYKKMAKNTAETSDYAKPSGNDGSSKEMAA